MTAFFYADVPTESVLVDGFVVVWNHGHRCRQSGEKNVVV